jgi:hypothetical protein
MSLRRDAEMKDTRSNPTTTGVPKITMIAAPMLTPITAAVSAR